MITWSDVTDFAPALLSVPTVAGDAIIAMMDERTWACFGASDSATVRYAQLLFAAHEGTLALISGSGGGLTAGPVTSESAGGLSVSYGSGGSTFGASSNYGATSYGQRYLRLARVHCGGPRLVNACG